MPFDEFLQSIGKGAKPGAEWSGALRGLWHDARGDWDGAHRCVQEDQSREAAWVHAYLHRKEGDLGNAGYWYARAGRRPPERGADLAAEWEEIARALVR